MLHGFLFVWMFRLEREVTLLLMYFVQEKLQVSYYFDQNISEKFNGIEYEKEKHETNCE